MTDVRDALIGLNDAIDMYWNEGRTDSQVKNIAYWQIKSKEALSLTHQRYWESRWRDEKAENDQLRATPAVGGEVLAEYYRKGLKSIVDCVNPMTRAAVREACAEILANAPAAQPAAPLRGGELLEAALKHIDFDGMDPNTFTIAELRRAVGVATPAVGGEPVAWRWRPCGAVNWIYDPTPEWRIRMEHENSIEIEPLFAAQPASPLRGREALVDLVDAVECELDIEYRSFAFRKRFSAAKAALASPPEQPAAMDEWPEHAVSTDRLNQLVRWANDPNSTYAELSKSETKT